MQNTIHRFLTLLLLIGSSMRSLGVFSSLPKKLYVVPFSMLIDSDRDGSLLHPYSTIKQALDQIEQAYHPHQKTADQTTINLYPTYYFVNTTINVNQMHSHTRLTTMSDTDTNFYETLPCPKNVHRRLRTAVISGGIPITDWTRVSENTYSAVVPSSLFVNQLFVDNQRIPRTRIPKNYSEYLYYAAPLNDSTMVKYGFQYVSGQFDYKSLSDAMVVIFHSWTESHHYIDRLITSNNTVLFSNPSHYAIGIDGIEGNRRFHIENLCEALVPNSFCFVNETKTVYLMTDGSYDPTKVEIITSVTEIVLSIASDNASSPIEDVVVDNVAIWHGAWNINRTQVAEGPSAEFLKSSALFIDNATSIIMSNIEISHTGSYGMRIREETSNIILINSLINDTGAGGIWMGDRSRLKPVVTNSSKIISNEISYGGNVFPSGVGILVYRGADIVIADNVIHHHRYNGISIGDQSGYGHPWTRNMMIQGNYIYNTGQHILCDQGGIYILGVQPGTVVHGNVVKNVFSYIQFMWGIYLDDGASDITVSNNVVYNPGWSALFQHYGANNTIINNVFARSSLIEPSNPGDPYPDGNIHIQMAENHTSCTYMRNIVYDTFQGANHSAVKMNPEVIVSFNYNVYYSTYGIPLFFGPQRNSFFDWQKTGQDNDSIIADPLFVGDVHQCDFFTVQSNSPAAKLGFVNITKPSKWTFGCDFDDNIRRNQFYHW